MTARAQAGFVQILVLVSLTGLGAAVTAAMSVARSGNEAGAALERTIAADLLATSAFRRISSAIADPADSLELALLERGGTIIDLAGSTVGLELESEASKINLQRADLAIVRRYALNAGLAVPEAEVLTRELATARSSPDPRQSFYAVLTALAGKRTYAELAEDLTIFGETAGIDPAYATARTLSAIPDLSPAQVALLQGVPPNRRRDIATSQFFAQSGSRYSFVASIDWGNGETQRRLVVAITAAGRALTIAPGL